MFYMYNYVGDPDNCLQLYENKVNTTRATEVTTNNEG